MFTLYNLSLPTVLYPVKEVPLFTHQRPPAPPHQNEPTFDAGLASHSSNPPSTNDVPDETAADHNLWSTISPSVASSTKHGWLHLPALHLPHPHVDLSHLRRHKVAITKSTDPTPPDAPQRPHHPYLPSSPTWPAHLFPHTSPFHWSNISAAAPSASTTSPQPTLHATPFIPPADVREFPHHYVLELEAPGLPATDSDSDSAAAAAVVSVTWMSPRTVLVSGRTARRALPSDPGAQDGGELCRTPTHEEGPLGSAAEGGAGRNGEGEAEEEEGQGKLLHAERAVGEWRRSFVLPSDAAPGLDPSGEVGGDGGVRWEVEDGVVRVWVAKVRD